MAQSYRPFPTTLNSAEASLVEGVLRNCAPCNLMCMAPHTIPLHSRYTHVHDCGSSIFVIIMTRVQGNGLGMQPDSFRALIEDGGKLLMKGVVLPVGHYPVSGIPIEVQTFPPSTAPLWGDGLSTGPSLGSGAATAALSPPSGLPGDLR